jgi:hypothetical protein
MDSSVYSTLTHIPLTEEAECFVIIDSKCEENVITLTFATLHK